jgi:hypothetical protein
MYHVFLKKQDAPREYRAGLERHAGAFTGALTGVCSGGEVGTFDGWKAGLGILSGEGRGLEPG